MKTTGFRSMVLYILFFCFVAGVGVFLFRYIMDGGKWAMQPYNGHLAGAGVMGTITDRNDTVLAYSEDGSRIYNDSETVRRSLLHTVGDTANNISVGVQYTMRSKLSGYNIITGVNETIFSRIGNQVKLTVDSAACAAAYTGLDGHNGGVLVYNYKTGEILCKVSAPTFDPGNVPEDLETNEIYEGVYLDNTLNSSYTPGSIFKLVTAAAAMEKWPDSWRERSYECAGSYELGGDNITCLHGEAHGAQTMSSALGYSCNIYFAQLATDLGASALQAKAEEMGFDKEFSLGSIPTEISKFDVSSANTNQLGWASVGQYTALANPYHMMVLMGAIANGGEYVQPKLTENSDVLGELVKGDSRELLSSSTAAQLKALMRNNVENYYGDYLFPEGMQICAKTGTGEVGNSQGPNCWIVGFSQSESTPYAFAAIVEDGAGGIETAGNLMSQVLYALV